jgi:tetratricopeptide (TPR) repeat protein
MRRTVILGFAVLALAAAAPGWAKDAPAQPTAPAAKPAAPAPGSGGETIDNAKQYQHCIALARQNPTDGWEESLAWASLGGGDAARHCGAIALVGLRQYEEAAKRLEDLAKGSRGPATLRAGMLAQAGQAWLLAKDPERAYADQTAALKLIPGAPDLLVDRAESLAAAKNYKDALADLDQAVAAAPKRADALTFRATARRYLDNLKGAGEDIAKALALDPGYQDAWLENGILKRLAGDDAAARQAWLKVLEIDAKSVAADEARRNIELLDVKTR